MKKYRYDESEYRALVASAKEKWEFVFYDGIDPGGRQIIWRHDVDCSPHRALALAKIEHRMGVGAIYFFYFHSIYYNLLEDGIIDIASRIAELGHQIGLHFDPRYYGGRIGSMAELERFLSLERHMLENVLEREINVFSFHNPTLSSFCSVDDNRIAGMLNADGKMVNDFFHYASDSRGGWKRKDLPGILHNGSEPRLLILTHPVRWTPDPMSERDILLRCLDGRNEYGKRIASATMRLWGNVWGDRKTDQEIINRDFP